VRIASRTWSGVRIGDPGTDKNAVLGNLIGTDKPAPWHCPTWVTVCASLGGRWSIGSAFIWWDHSSVRSEVAQGKGPHLLTETDRKTQDQPRTIRNDPSTMITAATGMAPLVEEARFQEMNRQIERRGKTQRGMPPICSGHVDRIRARGGLHAIPSSANIARA